MARILLVEKRYDKSEKNPSITAKWIEVPDGEVEFFLAKQLESFSETEKITEEKREPETQVKSGNTRISDTLIRLSTPISLLAVAITAAFKILSQNH